MSSPSTPTPQPSLAGGSTINWAAALDENRSWMQTVVRSRTRDPHTADEVMQEIALTVLRSDQGPRDPGKLGPWLYRIAVRQTINHRRRSGRQQRLVREFADRAAPPESSNSSPRDWLLIQESRQHVNEALAELSPQDREILLLKYTEGWTYKQLAKQLGVKTKTVEHRLCKARQQLRRQLSRRGFEAKR